MLAETPFCNVIFFFFLIISIFTFISLIPLVELHAVASQVYVLKKNIYISEILYFPKSGKYLRSLNSKSNSEFTITCREVSTTEANVAPLKPVLLSKSVRVS